MIELFIDGKAVDTAPDTKITLNFKSNIFGDISKIEASNSFTIALPKTPTNNKIFGLPAVVGGSSLTPYRRWNAELYVNGVTVVDTAYAVLLSVGDSYEIALYWGVVTALSTLKDSGKTLADINEVLEIQYGGENWWQSWEGSSGKTLDGVRSNNLINAVYEAGIDDLRNNTTAREQVALLPSVRVSWLWNRIVAQSGLNISKPSQFTQMLSKLALPFTHHRTTMAEQYSTNFTKANIKTRDNDAIATFHTATTTAISPYFTIENDTIELKVQKIRKKFDSAVYRASESHTAFFEVSASGIRNRDINPFESFLYISKNGEDVAKVSLGNFAAFNTTATASIELEMGDVVFAYIYASAIISSPNLSINSASLKVERQEDRDQVMGGMINTRDNLPDISQLDFVKAMCAMFGLWATLVDGVVYLVNFSDFYTQAAVDWSGKIVGTCDSDAANTTYTLADYAQRNILRYKEDDTVKIDASGALVVDNENINSEKEMLTLPFAASDGNIIPHLKWKDDDSNTGEVEEVDVVQRIMVLDYHLSYGGTSATLSFDGLKFSQLIPMYYDFWQKIMRNPIVIEEKVQLSEIDIKMLDFRKPIYLQKYGAQFVVDNVQWSEGEPSTVTLVKLPPANEIGVAQPYSVTTGVSYSVGIGGGVDAVPSLSYLVSGAGEYFAKSATILFDEIAGANVQLSFKEWVSPSGRVISTDNPYIYDGSNGDLEIIAMTEESLVIG